MLDLPLCSCFGYGDPLGQLITTLPTLCNLLLLREVAVHTEHAVDVALLQACSLESCLGIVHVILGCVDNLDAVDLGKGADDRVACQEVDGELG